MRAVRRAEALVFLCLAISGSIATEAAGSQRGDERWRAEAPPNPSYDGRFTFARLRYAGPGCMTDEGPGWHHDYPVAERNLMKIMKDLTALDARVDSSVVFDPDDPGLLRYPVAYLSEPGCWDLSDAEVEGLRSYLHKGGFLIVDDFRGIDWENFAYQMERVLPGGRFVPIERSDPVFHVFFGLDEEKIPALLGGSSPFQGIYEANDSTKRLMVIANYNLDIGDFWQWSPADFLPVAAGNEAYKFGVNYIFYGLTH